MLLEKTESFAREGVLIRCAAVPDAHGAGEVAVVGREALDHDEPDACGDVLPDDEVGVARCREDLGHSSDIEGPEEANGSALDHDGAEASGVLVGGDAVVVGQGELDLPPR